MSLAALASLRSSETFSEGLEKIGFSAADMAIAGVAGFALGHAIVRTMYTMVIIPGVKENIDLMREELREKKYGPKPPGF